MPALLSAYPFNVGFCNAHRDRGVVHCAVKLLCDAVLDDHRDGAVQQTVLKARSPAVACGTVWHQSGTHYREFSQAHAGHTNVNSAEGVYLELPHTVQKRTWRYKSKFGGRH